MTRFSDTIEAIVKAAGQYEDYLKSDHFHLKIENGPYMDLVIESWWCNYQADILGVRHTSVAHYYEQNGDLMPDPDVVIDTGTGAPIEITQPPPFGYFRVRWSDPDNGHAMINRYQDQAVRSFLTIWSRNLREQGFVQAAKSMKAGVEA